MAARAKPTYPRTLDLDVALPDHSAPPSFTSSSITLRAERLPECTGQREAQNVPDVAIFGIFPRDFLDPR